MTDLDLFYRFMKAAESKKSASKRRRVYALAKLLVLSSTDDHFISVFRTSSEMADIMKYLRDGVEFGMWDDDLTSRTPEITRDFGSVSKLY